MKKNNTASFIITVVIVLLVILGIYFVVKRNNNNPSTASVQDKSDQVSGGASEQGNQPASQNQLFSSSQFSKNSYLISGTSLDNNTKKATTGYTINRKILSDGNVQVTISRPNDSNFQTRTYTLLPNEKLYFVGSQAGSGSAGTTGTTGQSDQFIQVDSNGYIVNQ